MKINQNFRYIICSIILFVFLLLNLSLLFIHNFTLLFIIKNLFGTICHQIESRCFFVDEKPIFLCSRCTGIFTGAFIFFLFLSTSQRLREAVDKISHKTIFVFALPMLIEWSINFIFKIETTNFVRFLTGIIFSFIPVYFLNSLLINFKFQE